MLHERRIAFPFFRHAIPSVAYINFLLQFLRSLSHWPHEGNEAFFMKCFPLLRQDRILYHDSSKHGFINLRYDRWVHGSRLWNVIKFGDKERFQIVPTWRSYLVFLILLCISIIFPITSVIWSIWSRSRSRPQMFLPQFLICASGMYPSSRRLWYCSTCNEDSEIGVINGVFVWCKSYYILSLWNIFFCLFS